MPSKAEGPGEPFMVVLPPHIADRVRAEADERALSYSAYLRMLVALQLGEKNEGVREYPASHARVHRKRE